MLVQSSLSSTFLDSANRSNCLSTLMVPSIESTLRVCISELHLTRTPLAAEVAYNTWQSAKGTLFVALLIHVEQMDGALVWGTSHNIIVWVETDVTNHGLISTSSKLIELLPGPSVPDSHESALGAGGG